MAAHRLGVALLLPRHIAHDVDAFRRGLGAPTDRVPPHITLLNAKDVDDDQLDAAIAHVRRIAAAESNLHLVIGPVRTFHPVTPVVYLGVSGPGLDAIPRLRDALDADVLVVPAPEHEFVPHVTLSMEATPEQVNGAMASMDRYREVTVIEAITILELGDDATWRPLADAAFGATTATRTIGAEAVTIAVTDYPTHTGATMGRYRSLSVEAFADGRVVGVAHGHVADGGVAWLDELVVVRETRSTGVGSVLARAFADAAREAKATEVRAVRGATIAGFLVRFGFVVDKADEFVLGL